MSSASSTQAVNVCAVCDRNDNLLRCARCKLVYYCSKKHQKKDWRTHKQTCKDNQPLQEKYESNTTTVAESEATATHLPVEGSSEAEILSSGAELLTTGVDFEYGATGEKSSTEKILKNVSSAVPISGENIVKPSTSKMEDFPEISLRSSSSHPPFLDNSTMEEMCRNVIRDMEAYGVCVVDNFLGEERGRTVLAEVLNMYSKGVFRDGQLVSSTGRRGDLKTIRGDQITWIDGRERGCANIGYLISQVDAIILRATKMVNNGQFGKYNIRARTKVSNFKLGS